MTVNVSGTTYMTSNMFLHEIYRVYCTLHGWVSGSNHDLFDLGIRFLQSLESIGVIPQK